MTSEAAVNEPTIAVPDGPWRAFSACSALDPAIFYPDKDDEVGQARARSVCGACPVQMACLDWALFAGEQEGFWGGTSREERRRLARTVHGTPERFSAGCRCDACSLSGLRYREAKRATDWLLGLKASSV